MIPVCTVTVSLILLLVFSFQGSQEAHLGTRTIKDRAALQHWRNLISVPETPKGRAALQHWRNLPFFVPESREAHELEGSSCERGSKQRSSRAPCPAPEISTEDSAGVSPTQSLKEDSALDRSGARSVSLQRDLHYRQLRTLR
ncbi:hypothetical protein NDU88_011712 [Pleurodeles waltl]|uniref:Uncharacterized protein n=1 Tax=Pleurodeles waltl TaxID=8319 RepID=A0AAV7QZK2_PLEWA|nr:hypothetical protein NDU88_011712 [Pleurodeles waltl]